ncbi:hypothetical protein MPER_07369 [Moniliophthora perniciosa FA553]|nr:hypothetical protein MPER_07369 [Moniliophthora perniciosa FA553]
MSPFRMMMGYDPRPLPTAFGETNAPSVENRLKEIKRIRGEVASLMELATQKILRRNGRKVDTFERNCQVFESCTDYFIYPGSVKAAVIVAFTPVNRLRYFVTGTIICIINVHGDRMLKILDGINLDITLTSCIGSLFRWLCIRYSIILSHGR